MIRPRPTRNRRSGLLLTSCVLMVGGLFILLLNNAASPIRLGSHRLGDAFELAAAGLGILVAGMVYWWARRRGRLDPFDAPVWFSVNAYGQVVLNVWILQRDQGFSGYVSSMTTESAPAMAVFLMGVGLLAFWGGYLAATRFLSSRPRPVQHRPGKPRWRLIILLWFVCEVLEVLSVISGGSGYLALGASIWTNYLAFAAHLGDLATFLLLLQHFRYPRTIGWLWLFALVATNVSLGLVMGTKSAVFVLLYAVMAIYYVRRRLSVRWLAVGFLALLVIVPTVNTFRANLYAAGFDRTAGAAFGDRVPILHSSLASTLSNPLSGLAEQTRDTFEQRQGSLLEITVAIMAVHPTLRPFIGLDILAYFAEQTIPRVFWPGKPAGHPNLYLILSSYLGLPDHSWATPGQFADAYRAGGWPFVIIWLSLLGALSAWFYSHGPRTGDLAGTAFYLLLLTSFVTYEDHIVTTTMEFLKFGVLLLLANRYLLFKPPKRQSRSHSDLVLPGGTGSRQTC
jgi:hypothetical protein